MPPARTTPSAATTATTERRRMDEPGCTLVAKEEAVHEADLHDEEEPEGEGAHPGPDGESAMQCQERHPEGKGEQRGDHRHAADGSEPEEEEIGRGGIGALDGGEHEERHGGAARQAMDDADADGARRLDPSDRLERAPKAHRGARLGWLLLAVAIPNEPDDAEDTEHEEHHRDYQLEGQADGRRHREVEDDDRHAGRDDGGRMPDAPEGADERPRVEAARAADNRRHGDDVIRVRRMLEPEEKAQTQRGQQASIHQDLRTCSPWP